MNTKEKIIVRRPGGAAPRRPGRLAIALQLAALLLPAWLGAQSEPSALFEVQGTDKGILLPRMTLAQRDAIASPAKGLMVYNTTAGCLEINHGSSTAPQWLPVNCEGRVGAMNCGDATTSGSLSPGRLATGIVATVPYTGGNGGAHGGQTVASAGVTGLSASLAAGNFSPGAGTLDFVLGGTPASAGTAVFALNIGGQSCNLALTVAPPPGAIGELLCGEAAASGSLMPQQAAVGVSIALPYEGGNGGAYGFQAVASTGLTGLTAILDPGTLANGSGSLHFTIVGTAPVAGRAFFPLEIGGQSCTLKVDAGCGAYLANGVWKGFMCHNLASANTAADPFQPSWEVNGGYWQWGRKGPDPSQWLNTNSEFFAHGPTGPAFGEENSNYAGIWNQTSAPLNAWNDFGKSPDDPCPAGYRVPTRGQWEAVLANNPLSMTGTWSQDPINYSSGVFLGSALMLPASGGRNSMGLLFGRGSAGYYWSSTGQGPAQARSLYVDDNFQAVYDVFSVHSFGYSVRCVAE